MSKATATRARPLSPHLQIYRFPMTGIMSIMHRITGGALYFGTLLVVCWLLAASISEQAFDLVSTVYGSWLGQAVLLGYTWALIHHMLGGIRHFVWDTASYIDKDTATKLAWATLAGSIVLTIVVWVVGYMVRGF